MNYDKDIEDLGRFIVSILSSSEIPYTDYKKCQVFSISWSFPNWSLYKGKNSDCSIGQHSHILISWNAKPKANSSIIWSNVRQIKTDLLISLIKSIKRNSKLDKVLKYQ